MPKPVERFRQTDVNFWGIAAIAACGIAVSTASLPTLLPPQVFSALHTSRISGADVNALRAELATLEMETTKLRSETDQISTRIGLADRNRGDIVQRVGALENSLPLLMEQIPPGQAIDASIITSSTGNNRETTPIEGGSVEITRTPLYPQQDMVGMPETESDSTPMPEQTNAETPFERTEMPNLEQVSSEEFGIAVGGTVTVNDAYVSWLDLRSKVGALLIGMEPILSASNTGYHIVAGPVERIARAEELCAYVERAGLQCLPVPYAGYRMPQ